MILKDNPEMQAEMVRRLVEVYHPKLIYLFGSQAWGEPGQGSDIDVYVILEDSIESKTDRIRHGMYQHLDFHLPIDLLVVTEAEIADRKDHPSTLTHKIMAKGVQLYAAA